MGELGCKLCCVSWKEYWADAGNKMDCSATLILFAVGVLWADPTIYISDETMRYFTILRLLRLVRLLAQVSTDESVQFTKKRLFYRRFTVNSFPSILSVISLSNYMLYNPPGDRNLSHKSPSQVERFAFICTCIWKMMMASKEAIGLLFGILYIYATLGVMMFGGLIYDGNEGELSKPEHEHEPDPVLIYQR